MVGGWGCGVWWEGGGVVCVVGGWGCVVCSGRVGMCSV